MSGTYNGSCRCDECDSTPAAPTPHFPRLEATDDIWPTTEGA